MKALIIDAVSVPATVMLREGPRLIQCQEITPPRSLSEKLLPTITGQLVAAGWKVEELDRVAVVNAPASFTSLRIGIAVANALAYATATDLVSLTVEEATSPEVMSTIAGKDPETSLRPAYGRAARITDSKRPPA